MILNDKLFDELRQQALASPRLRAAYDLRTTPDDQSQRMLNAMEPGTEIPIHRHKNTTEVVVVLRGKVRWLTYADNGEVTEDILLDANGEVRAITVEKGQWHSAISLESGTIILEAKDGPWTPITEENTLHIKPQEKAD